MSGVWDRFVHRAEPESEPPVPEESDAGGPDAPADDPDAPIFATRKEANATFYAVPREERADFVIAKRRDGPGWTIRER